MAPRNRARAGGRAQVSRRERPGFHRGKWRHATCYVSDRWSSSSPRPATSCSSGATACARQSAGRLAWPPGATGSTPRPSREPVGEEVRRELAEIDAALRRIEQGSFGTCLACGGPMGLQRMRAIPEARYCVGCSGQGLEGE